MLFRHGIMSSLKSLATCISSPGSCGNRMGAILTKLSRKCRKSSGLAGACRCARFPSAAEETQNHYIIKRLIMVI